MNNSTAPTCRLGLLLGMLVIACWTPIVVGAEHPVAGLQRAPAAFAVSKQLPPPLAGTSELRFGDIYRNPVGPQGLELSERALSLDGKRVRIVGFMVAEGAATPDVFMLAPMPVTIDGDDEQLADDLPPSTVFVHLDSGTGAGSVVPHLPGLIQLSGTLSVGAEAEAIAGRVSTVRLQLDRATTRKLTKLNRQRAAVAAR